MRARNLMYTGSPCGACGKPTRRKFEPGKSTKASRLQQSRWWVCERGHQLYRSRG